jgi:hypothetical protein
MAPATHSGEEKIKDQSPIEEVVLTVPTTDDSTLPVDDITGSLYGTFC